MSDEEVRGLEVAARAGAPEDRARLRAARERRGLPLDELDGPWLPQRAFVEGPCMWCSGGIHYNPAVSARRIVLLHPCDACHQGMLAAHFAGVERHEKCPHPLCVGARRGSDADFIADLLLTWRAERDGFVLESTPRSSPAWPGYSMGPTVTMREAQARGDEQRRVAIEHLRQVRQRLGQNLYRLPANYRSIPDPA